LLKVEIVVKYGDNRVPYNPRSFIVGFANQFRGFMTLGFVAFSEVKIACVQEMGA
jgi:hypothetical protein